MTRSMDWHLPRTRIQLKKYECLKRKSVCPIFYGAYHERPHTSPAKLKIQLQEQNNNVPSTHRSQACYRPSSASSSVSSRQTPLGGTPLLQNAKDGSELALRQSCISPELHEVTDRSSADTLLELIYSGWNPDLPEPQILNH